MTTRSRSIACLALVFGAFSCANQEPDDSSGESAEQALSAVENVDQYSDCLLHGVSTSTMDLAHLVERDPGTRATFAAAECIIGHLSEFQGRSRPYSLQSFKKYPAGQTFFFKRASWDEAGEPPSECLKIKLSVVVGATDTFVTIRRVKQLPLPRADGLCTDNGEI